MKAPQWFWVLGGLWLVLELPGLLLGAMWSGGFDLIPDPPPYFQAPYEDRSFVANLTWAVEVATAYMPLFLIPALAIWKWRKRRVASDS
jgi:hypothetical protein